MIPLVILPEIIEEGQVDYPHKQHVSTQFDCDLIPLLKLFHTHTFRSILIGLLHNKLQQGMSKEEEENYLC